MTIIEDGLTGNIANVNNDNRLSVVAVDIPFDHYESDYNGYVFSYFVEATTNGSDNCILHINNTSQTNYVLSQIVPTCTTASEWTIKFGESYASGGTLMSSFNFNTSSTNIADITVYKGDAIATTGTAQNIAGVYMNSNTAADFTLSKSLIIGSGKKISVYCKAATGNARLRVSLIKHK